MGLKIIASTCEHTCDHCDRCVTLDVQKIPQGWGRLTVEEPLYCSSTDTAGVKTSTNVSAGIHVKELILCEECLFLVRQALSVFTGVT